jgi:NodT family efflux transporter outer membrane factor (OMF) lipoprotein
VRDDPVVDTSFLPGCANLAIICEPEQISDNEPEQEPLGMDAFDTCAARWRMIRTRAVASSACLLAACVVGPEYEPPAIAIPATWQSQPRIASRDEGAESPTLASWWTVLNDATLDRLIENALAANTTVRLATARVVESRARRAITSASLWPTSGGGASAVRSDSDLSNGPDDNYEAGLDAAWEIDLFGANRRALEASTAQLAASEADLRDVLVVLLGDVALSYVDLRTAQARLDYAERNLASQREVVDITGWRAEAGLATELDVEQAKSSYAQTQAALPLLDSSLDAARNRLAVLTGQTPADIAALLAERKPIPRAPADVVASVPADVIRRRPDVRAAEARLIAQSAAIGVATAALYPSLSLSGSIGLSAAQAGDLLSTGIESSRYGLSLSVPIFRAGALRANVAAQNAIFDQALAGYEGTVLAVYEEVENALTGWANEQRRHQALVDAARSARIASELALMQYNSGLVDFQTVLTADRQVISSEDALAVSQGELTANLIRLYKAYGGGWAVFPDARGS